MTPEEAIKILEKKKEYSERIIDNFLSHSRGEIKDANETIEMCDMAISALKEIRQYREIGTVEECREAVEKKNAKNIIRIAGQYPYKCPTCNGKLEIGYRHCIICGQLLRYPYENLICKRNI